MKIQNTLNQPRGMKRLYALGEKRAIDLSLSENPLGCSPLVFRVLEKGSFSFNDYPKPNGVMLKTAVAKKLNCENKNIFICNGSEAIINAIPKVFANAGDEVIIPSLTFPMFSLCSQLAGLRVVFAPMSESLEIDLTKMMSSITLKTKLIFICNPNNPTGSVIQKDRLLTFIDQVPSTILVVVDEANIEFGGDSLLEASLQKPNLVIVRTFSKAFGLASARIGMAIGDEKIIQKLEEETPIFPVSELSERLAVAALQDNAFLAQTKKFIDMERNRIKDVLIQLGFTVFPSKSNNLFVKIPDQISQEFFWKVMKQQDISLVQGSSFAGFDNTFFRVSPRLSETNTIFLTTIDKVVKGSDI